MKKPSSNETIKIERVEIDPNTPIIGSKQLSPNTLVIYRNGKEMATCTLKQDVEGIVIDLPPGRITTVKDMNSGRIRVHWIK